MDWQIPAPEEEQEMFEHFRLNVDPGQEPVRIDKWMSAHLEDTSRHRIQCAIKEGFVQVGEKTVKANYIVRPGDVVRFVMPYRRRGVDIKPQDIPLDIVYEDDDVLVVNKPAGMVVHPGHGHFDGTLVNALLFHLGREAESGEASDDDDAKAGILVHRIDKDTSGLLLVAKNDESQMHLARQFYDHSIERCYRAIVWGNMPEDEGTVEGYIGRDTNDRLRFRVVPDEDSGKWAVTHWKVLERFGFITYIECRLETGRTHQIRVHMASLGHPLFGDERYGGTEIRQGTIYAKYKQFIHNCMEICPRQALHAKTIGFEHPATRKWMRFDSQLPEDMTALLEKWRKYVQGAS
ncbi:MAG: RluA family pseudouridine synthase [Bacteroidales bacterium]|nr:RluA family pseudouridine synthase [Bacteroidales bacterium]